MNANLTESTATSTVADMSDLDGYSIPNDYNFQMQHQYGSASEDFGFDPPQPTVYPKSEPFSPPTMADPLQLSGWSGFESTDGKEAMLTNQLPSPDGTTPQAYELGRMLNQTLPQSHTAISRFGQVTPPRSNSATSDDSNNKIAAVSPKASSAERRKRAGKAPSKEDSEPSTTSTTSRKRKNTRKSSSVKDEQDDKRRQSLEKNRLAAAKCRINKKEKTEQLQRNSHEKAVHNAFLKEQVMRMKEEVQQMNALLLAHANCDGCKSPEEIQKHLSNLGNEFFTQHMSPMSYDYPQVNLQDSSMGSDYYGHGHSGSSMLNPPLPDFDTNTDFECHTPMQND